MKTNWLAVALLSAACILSGCGGGGSDDPQTGGTPGTGTPGTGLPGDTGGTPGGGGAANAWLSFSPASVSQTVKERSFMLPISIVATSSKTIAERINVAIVDPAGVLNPDATSVAELSTTSYEARLSLSPTLKPGTYKGSFKVQLCLDDARVCQQPYPGSPWLVPYAIEVTPWAQPRAVHKLLVSETGLALTSAPNLSLLTRSIRVSDNLGKATRWQARSDQPWLTVTPSGAAGEALQIQADPSALAADTISYATVSVSSQDTTIAAAQPVVVALWKGSELVRPRASFVNTPSRYFGLLADPIRPHVYAHFNGARIDVYNIYTGAMVGTLSAADASFGQMVASPDGAFLYAVDMFSSQLKVFDVRAGQLVASWPLDEPTMSDRGKIEVVYARPNGVGVVVATTGQIFRASDGKLLANKVTHAPDLSQFKPQLAWSYIAASPDGTRIYSTGALTYNPDTPFYWDIDYNETDTGTLSYTRPVAANLGPVMSKDDLWPGAIRIAVSRDGTQVLMLSYQHDISLWNPADLSRTGLLTQGLAPGASTLIVAADGRIVVADSDYSGYQFHVISADGKLVKTLSTTLPASIARPGDAGTIYAVTDHMKISADGAIAIQSAYRSRSVFDNAEYLLTFAPITP